MLRLFILSDRVEGRRNNRLKLGLILQQADDLRNLHGLQNHAHHFACLLRMPLRNLLEQELAQELLLCRLVPNLGQRLRAELHHWLLGLLNLLNNWYRLLSHCLLLGLLLGLDDRLLLDHHKRLLLLLDYRHRHWLFLLRFDYFHLGRSHTSWNGHGHAARNWHWHCHGVSHRVDRHLVHALSHTAESWERSLVNYGLGHDHRCGLVNNWLSLLVLIIGTLASVLLRLTPFGVGSTVLISALISLLLVVALVARTARFVGHLAGLGLTILHICSSLLILLVPWVVVVVTTPLISSSLSLVIVLRSTISALILPLGSVG